VVVAVSGRARRSPSLVVWVVIIGIGWNGGHLVMVPGRAELLAALVLDTVLELLITVEVGRRDAHCAVAARTGWRARPCGYAAGGTERRRVLEADYSRRTMARIAIRRPPAVA